jgi:lysophospholipase L1-like esterase
MSKIAQTCLFLVSFLLSLVLIEGVLRLKNADMRNYDIEMWRYSKLLKVPSDNPALGHEHRPAHSATLQSVELRINDRGLRGDNVPPVVPGKRRILFLGSSITLGWGVPESETVTERLRAKFKADGIAVDVLNAGIGNYNAPRYVERFLTRLEDLKPTDIVVHYFLRDAESLPPEGGNWLLRHSELALTFWSAYQKNFGKARSLEQHYRDVYDPAAPGYRAMRDSLKKLSEYAHAHHIRLYLAMIPDVHNLKNYPFSYIHEDLQKLARADGYQFIDLYPALQGLEPAQIWSMPGDPHPNAEGHRRMADALYPVLKAGSPKA